MLGSLPSRIHEKINLPQVAATRVVGPDVAAEWRRLKKNGMKITEIAKRFRRSRYCVQIHCKDK